MDDYKRPVANLGGPRFLPFSDVLGYLEMLC